MPTSSPFHILSIGDFVIDILVGVNQFPIYPASHQIVNNIDFEPGGAGNFLIAGSRLGLNMSALGAIGNDKFSQSMLNLLEQENIDISGIVRQEDGETTKVIVLADDSGKHVFLGHHGEGPVVSFSENWRTLIKNTDAFQAWGYALREERFTQAFLDSMVYAKELNVPVFLDPGPHFGDATLEQRSTAVKNADVILLTEDEIPSMPIDAKADALEPPILGESVGKIPPMIEGLGGRQHKSYATDAKKLLELGPSMVCVKLGAQGCEIFTKNDTAKHPGFPVTVRDTSAAGDSFDAAFIYAYLHKWTLPQIAAFANAMGAAKVKKYGTGRQVPTADEIRQILEEFEVDIKF